MICVILMMLVLLLLVKLLQQILVIILVNDYNKKENSSPFFNCTLKINNQLIKDTQDLLIVMPMYNLLNYSKNFRKATGSFWNYYPD